MRGTQRLLVDTSLALFDGQKVGIIGRNGSGKTSLFAALSGQLSLDQGTIKIPDGLRRSTMAQETTGSERSALNFVIDADRNYRRLESQLKQAEIAGKNEDIASLHGDLDAIGAYDIGNRAEQLLSGLGFAVEQFEDPVYSFSGGWRVRLNLAAALMCPSDLLMLDEPTNHLDLEASLWLEQWLQKYAGTLLIVSHDRSFLDKIIDHIVSFEGRSLRLYKGNYSAYEKQRAERMAQEIAQFEKQQRRRAEIEDFVRRFRAKATKARQAQSRLKELNRMQDIAPAHIDSPFRFQFPALDKLPDFLLSLEDLTIGFGEPLISKIKLSIRSDTRIGLLGYNGSGKSTLLKVMAEKLQPLAGNLQPARLLKVGYFAQHQVDELDLTSTPLEILQAVKRGAREQEIRDYLGGFDFKGPRADEVINVFSGGEKARLALAKVAWQEPNLLLLDEPSNHLDLEMRHALTVALQEFAGAIVLVSHDRHLLANTVEEFYLIHQGKFCEFDGDLQDYEKWLHSNERVELQARRLPRDKEENKKEQRQQAAARRQQLAPLRKQGRALEQKIDQLHAQLKQLDQTLSDPVIYEEEKKEQLRHLLVEQGQLASELDRSEEEWIQIQEQIESAH